MLVNLLTYQLVSYLGYKGNKNFTNHKKAALFC